jgi:hypothetical protein
MTDGFEFTLHSPLAKEDWNKLLDVERENTAFVTFQTPQGRQVRYIKCEVLDKIRAEIEHMIPCSKEALSMKLGVLEILDEYIESEGERCI